MAAASNNSDEANSSLQRALATTPKRADLYHDAALYLGEHGKSDQALRLLDKGIATLPDNPDLLLTRAAMLAASHKVGEAETALKDIEKRWPEWPNPYVTYGILLEGQKRSADARKQLQTAMSLGAAGPEAYFYFAKSTLDVAPDEVDAADSAIKQAVLLAPDDPDIQLLAGRIDVQKHRYEDAVQHLTAAVRLRPDYLQARFTLAQAYRALGRKEDAARESQEFQRLRALHPESEEDAK